MSAVDIEVGQVRMASYGRYVVRRTGAEAGPMPHRNMIMPIREDLAHAQQQAVARLDSDGSVEAGIFQRAAHQHMAVAARNQIQVFLEQDMLERRRVELEQ